MHTHHRLYLQLLSTIIVPAVLILAGLQPTPAAAAYNNIGFMVQTWAGSDSFYLNVPTSSRLSESYDHTSLGTSDVNGLTNSGWAGIEADLADAGLSAFALANNSMHYICIWDGSCFWSWSGGGNHASASAAVQMADDVYFTIPAGTYLDPLVVGFRGHADYYLSAAGDYFARADFRAAMYGPVGRVQRYWAAEGPEVVSQVWPGPTYRLPLYNGQIGGVYPFQLGAVLLPPGTTLDAPKVVGLRLELALGHGWTLVSGLGTLDPEGYSYGDSRASLAIDTLYLPAGVTFTSSSGVFLSNVAVVPEPEAWALLLAGLGLVGWVTRRRHAV